MFARDLPPKQLKPDVIRTGDFVYCRSKRYRDQLQLRDESALIIEVKRSNFKVLYADDKRCWLPREVIGKVKPDVASGSKFLSKLHFLLKRVDAHECELISTDGVHRLSARIDQIDAAAVDEIRQTLAGDYISLAVVPEGMAFMQVEITFR